MFLSSHVKLVSDPQIDICSGNVSIRCSIGRAVMIISEETFVSDCKDSDTLSTSMRRNTTEVVTGVMTFIVICAVTIVSIIWRRKARSKSHCSGNVEGQNQQDEKEALLCTAEIISETSCVQRVASFPEQKTKDVIRLLQVVLSHSKYFCLTYTNARINEKRVKSSMAHKEDNHDCSVERYLYSKKHMDLMEIINFAIATDVKNSLVKETNSRINYQKWLSCRQQAKNKDATKRVSDRITNTKDLSQAIKTFKNTDSSYYHLMESNMRIKFARNLMSEQEELKKRS